MSRVLLIEDDLTLSFNLREYLSAEGYSVELANRIEEAERLGLEFDVIVLDWMLPDGQGVDYLRSVRKRSSVLPVLFLTAKADLVDRVVGLEAGANDYIVKPFEPRELLARLRAQLRQATSRRDVRADRRLCLDRDARQARFEGEIVETTRKEFDLLALFTTHPNRVFTRDELLAKIWGFDNSPTTRTVDTHILQLRQKFSEDLIETVRGIGYRYKPDEKFAGS